MTRSQRRSALDHGFGICLAAAAAGAMAVLDLTRLSFGDYRIESAEALGVVAVYGIFGLATGIALAPVLLLGRRLSRSFRIAPLVASPAASALYPIWTATPLVLVFLNTTYFPAFASAASVAGNLLVLATGIAIGWLCLRYRSVRLAAGALLIASAVGGLLAIQMTGAGPAAGGTEEVAERRGRPEAPPTLIVVLIDTLRPDHLGSYGYGLPTSPALDALADRSVVFEEAYSTSNWTRPAVASLMTSALPSRHGVIDFEFALPPELPLLAERLLEAGYRTGFFTSNPNVEAVDGYQRGVERYVQYSHRGLVGRTVLMKDLLGRVMPTAAARLGARVVEPGASSYSPESLTDDALAWLGQTGGPHFAYLHYTGPHDPYLPPPRYVEALGGTRVDERLAEAPPAWGGRDLLAADERRQMVLQYDAEILWHDAEIGRLVDFVAEREDVVLIVTSDHGEGFGENGVWWHGRSMFDEIVRIPLLVWCPRWCGPARRVEGVVSLLDIAPTLLELAGVDAPESFEGSSLLPLLSGSGPTGERPVVIENPLTREASIRTSDLVYARGPSPIAETAWLWRPGAAPEPIDRAAREGEALASLLLLRLDESRAGARAAARSEESADRLRELRALGYLD